MQQDNRATHFRMAHNSTLFKQQYINNYQTPRSHTASIQRSSLLQRVPRLKINDADILEETDINTLNYTYTNNSLAQHRQRRNSTNSVSSQLNISPATSRRSSFSRNLFFPTDNNSLLNSIDLSAGDNSTIIDTYLRNAGFLPSQCLHQNIKIASTSNDILIPTISSNEDEYLARLNTRSHPQSYPIHTDNDISSMSLSDSESITKPATSAHTDNYSLSYFKLAIVVSVSNETSIDSIQLELSSRANIQYLSNNSNNTSFKVGELNWNLNKYNYNLFLPPNSKYFKHDIVENFNNIIQWKLFKNTYYKKRLSWQDDNESIWKDSLFQKYNSNTTNTTNSSILPPGDYIFIVPVVFNNHIPESHSFPSGNLDYFIRLATLQKSFESTASFSNHTSENSSISDANTSNYNNSVDITDLKLNDPHLPKNNNNIYINELYLQNKLTVIRTPPLISVSTANKSIYIDKIWDDSLAYEIILPNKYIPADSIIPITIKLSPLIKNISLKKFAIGISERINYSNPNDKELSFKETDHILKDRSNPYYHLFNAKKKKERLLLLYELRSEQAGPRALREEVVSNCINNNLLSYYRCKQNNSNSQQNGMSTDNFIEQIEIKTKLTIPSEKLDSSNHNQSKIKKKKTTENPYGIDGYNLIDEFNNLESFYPSTSKTSTTYVEPPIKEKTSRKNSFVNFFFGSAGGATTSTTTTTTATTTTTTTANNNKDISNKKPTNHFKTKINLFNKKNVAMIDTKIYNPKRGLYIDSTHFSTLKCKHKLEIIMKLEKCDSNNLLRQYEVVVNTPIYLMSNKCTNDNLELPVYDIDGDTYYQPTQQDVDPQSLPPPPTFKESLSNPLFPNNNINTDSIINSNDSNYTYKRINQNISSQLNTEFSNLDGLLNSDMMSPTYRRINSNNNATNVFPTMERVSSQPPAYLDVVPSQL